MIGAGPAGYTLSILLAKRGYKVDLFEKRSDPLTTNQSAEGRSTNLAFVARSDEACRRIGVLDSIINESAAIDYFTYHLSDG